MYFCDNCGFSLEISKSSSSNEDTREVVAKLADALKMIEDGEVKDYSHYKADFSKEEMTKNKKYQKLKDNEKAKLNQLFEELVASGAEFKCENCNFTKQITETTLLYQINMEDKVVHVRTLEDNELTSKDPLLPHTHDYTCKNPSCITHKKPELKDSVFLRDRNTYKLNYICCVCYYNW
jgi:hypothetical protein